MTAVQEDLARTAPTFDAAALQTLMCRAGLAVAVLDGTGRLSMLSPGLEHLLQRTFTAVPAESLAEVFHLYTEGGARLLQPHEVPIVRASRGEVVEDAVVTVRAPGQPVRHLRVNATPMLGPTGELQGAWAVVTDVTGPVAAARGELSRTLAETVNHNLRTPLTTLLCHAELLLAHQDSFSPEEARSLQAVWRAGRRLHHEVISISDWIDLASTPGAAGTDAEHRVAALEGIAGWDSPDDAARQVDLASAINLVGDGLLGLDRDGRVRFVNDAAARLLGREAANLAGTYIWDEFPTTVSSIIDRRHREAMETRQEVEFETHLAPLDTWCSIRLHPSPDGVTMVLRDVTTDRALVAERGTFVDRLLEAEDRERARIAADVHEDSLQALGAVALHLQLLHAHLPAPPPTVESLLGSLRLQVSEATDRLRTLLFSLEPTRTDVPIAQGIRTQAAHIFDGSSIHWSVDDIDAGEELAPAERSQALRVTKEALINARTHARPTEVIVSLRGDEAGVEIVISDNGTATDPADFTSAPGHRGLETMRDRAADVGGRCTIEPTTPHGCTVRLYMPRARAA